MDGLFFFYGRQAIFIFQNNLSVILEIEDLVVIWLLCRE